jgi:hypothetical protein
VAAEFKKLRVIVGKTGWPAEHEAMDFLEARLRSHLPSPLAGEGGGASPPGEGCLANPERERRGEDPLTPDPSPRDPLGQQLSESEPGEGSQAGGRS